jgi:hypothetical protein
MGPEILIVKERNTKTRKVNPEKNKIIQNIGNIVYEPLGVF